MHLTSNFSFTAVVGASDKTWSLGKGHEDQDLGTYLPLLSSHQGKFTLKIPLLSPFTKSFHCVVLTLISVGKDSFVVFYASFPIQ